MSVLRAPILLFLLLLTACQPNEAPAPVDAATPPDVPAAPEVVEITFQTIDSVQVYGDLHRVNTDQDAPLILLFHQGGSNTRGEYPNILPRLLDSGYHVLAIDQRRGGERYGSHNRTVAALDSTIEYGYCDAYPDLEAALQYVKEAGFTGPRVAWGSSYSGGLVLRLGAEYPDDLAGVLAFSPAASGPMEPCAPNNFIPALSLPALALRPGSEMEIESSQQQLALFEQHGHQTFVAPDGVHGSSMLDSTRATGDVEATWNVVLSFLNDTL